MLYYTLYKTRAKASKCRKKVRRFKNEFHYPSTRFRVENRLNFTSLHISNAFSSIDFGLFTIFYSTSVKFNFSSSPKKNHLVVLCCAVVVWYVLRCHVHCVWPAPQFEKASIREGFTHRTKWESNYAAVWHKLAFKAIAARRWRLPSHKPFAAHMHR